MLKKVTRWIVQTHKDICRSLSNRGRGISLLVPFHSSSDNDQRVVNWRWLREYWEAHLPGAELVIGDDTDVPFSKAVAMNRAAAQAKGDIFVLLDADCYVSPEVIVNCAGEIREARNEGHRLWFVPYRMFYRLTKESSNRVLISSPKNPLQFSTPPHETEVLDTASSQIGHWYGAMLQIMPREAFETVGGMDPRFRGWGGEDHAFMRAVDTLYWKHKATNNQVLHIWHPMISPEGVQEWVSWRDRMWVGQTSSGDNDALSGRYYGAHRDVARMRKLVEEGFEFERRRIEERKCREREERERKERERREREEHERRCHHHHHRSV